jgi:acetyltransferase-like isoleucine patch superfamily enzyme
MQRIIKILFKVVREINRNISKFLSTCYARVLFYLNGVAHGSITCYGLPYVTVSLKGQCTIGNGLVMCGGARFSSTSDDRPSKIIVRYKGILKIGENLGMTAATIYVHESITIGSNVKLGGGCQIFDTNFHSLDPIIRASPDDNVNAKNAPVVIGDNVFIGANCIVGKGITIGENSIVAAGAVVTRSIPANQIWGGNPAKFIKNV